MSVSSYKKQLVLKVFCKQICQDKALERQRSFNGKSSEGKNKVADKCGWQTVTEKIKLNIINKIKHFGFQFGLDEKSLNHSQPKTAKRYNLKQSKEIKFIFNEIKANNEKKTNTLSLEGSSFLIDQIEQIASNNLD